MTLFDQPRIIAYEKSRVKAPSLRDKIVELLKARGSVTLDDVCRELKKEPHKVSGRLSELSKSGIIARTNTQEVSGRTLSVYRLTASL
jgi:predicted ArsR family transcriptional regulator